MFLRPMVFLCALSCLFSCVSIDDAGRAYFKGSTHAQGVEPADALLERMKQDQELREITYGQITAGKIVQCTLLRNQLYVAAMKSSDKQILEAVKIIENGYQDNDEAFLKACDQVLATTLGKRFFSIQQQYMMRREGR